MICNQKSIFREFEKSRGEPKGWPGRAGGGKRAMVGLLSLFLKIPDPLYNTLTVCIKAIKITDFQQKHTSINDFQ